MKTGEDLSDFDGQGYMVLMRRGAEGQIRDSILIQRAADGSCAYFKAQTDGNGTVLTDENGQAKVTPLPDGTGLDYIGEEGEFSLLIPGYVSGREYTTVYETGDDRYAPGQHTIIATDGTAQLSCSFYLNKIDVTKEKNCTIWIKTVPLLIMFAPFRWMCMWWMATAILRCGIRTTPYRS